MTDHYLLTSVASAHSPCEGGQLAPPSELAKLSLPQALLLVRIRGGTTGSHDPRRALLFQYKLP